MPNLAGLSHRVWAAWGHKPARLYYTNGGIGDELMLTAIAAAARAAGRPIDVLVSHPDLWRDNSDPASYQTGLARWHYASLRRLIPTEVVHLSYENGNHRHIAAQMAAHAGVTLPADWRPTFPVGPSPIRDPRVIVLQNSCRGARYAATTKEWPAARWQDLATRLSRDFALVQIGTQRDPPLAGARDLRGRTSLHEAARVLAGAAAFVGLESGLMHVAAATSTPAVIIYGGRTRPHETGYAFNCNLTRNPPCAGCGLNDGCPHELVCLDISVDDVEAAVRGVIEKLARRI
jgi:hypothetical protein